MIPCDNIYPSLLKFMVKLIVSTCIEKDFWVGQTPLLVHIEPSIDNISHQGKTALKFQA